MNLLTLVYFAGVKILIKGLYRIMWMLVVVLWSKCLYDIQHADSVWKNASFPTWFTVLFWMAFLAIIPLAWWATSSLKELTNRKPTIGETALWLLIPICVLCVSPVCYKGCLLVTRHTIGTVIRTTLMSLPIVLFVINRNGKHTKQIVLVLLILSVFALFPNDSCRNQFNYWYVKVIGFSPLTYLPVVITILLLIARFFGKPLKVLLILCGLCCVGSLVISFGHRLSILW